MASEEFAREQVEAESARFAQKKIPGSADILRVVREGPLQEPAHVWLYEVRSKTGYGGEVRYADALVLSVFPSRGLFMAGIEVKVTRSDWLRELRAPSKADVLAKFCDYWWVAAPPDVVGLDELPKPWGLYVIEGEKCRVAKAAKRGKAKPPDMAFMTSLLRNYGGALKASRNHGYSEGYEAATERFGTEGRNERDEKIRELEDELRTAHRDKMHAEHKARELQGHIEAFEAAAGLDKGSILRVRGFGAQETGKLFKFALALEGMDLERIAYVLRSAADELAKVPDPRSAT